MQTTNTRHGRWGAIAAAAFAVAIGPLAAAQHAGSYTPADVENGARLFGQHCSTCHGADRVNDARKTAEGWRVVAVDMRERGARITDAELERLVEWLGRVKGTNDSQ